MRTISFLLFHTARNTFRFDFCHFSWNSLLSGVREQGKALWKKDGGFFIGNTCTQIAKFFHKIQHSCTIATSLLNNRLLFRMLQIEVSWRHNRVKSGIYWTIFGLNQTVSCRNEWKSVVRINKVWIFLLYFVLQRSNLVYFDLFEIPRLEESYFLHFVRVQS